MSEAFQLQGKAWRDRLNALKNVPLVLSLIWQPSRIFTAGAIGTRVLNALVPFGTLWVGKLIIDTVVAALKNPGPFPQQIWVYLALEFALTGASAILGRASDFCDARLADRKS